MTQIDTALDTIKDEPLDFANMLDDNNSGTTGNDEYDVNMNEINKTCKDNGEGAKFPSLSAINRYCPSASFTFFYSANHI